MFAPAWPPLRPGGAALAGNNEIDLNSITESSNDMDRTARRTGVKVKTSGLGLHERKGFLNKNQHEKISVTNNARC